MISASVFVPARTASDLPAWRAVARSAAVIPSVEVMIAWRAAEFIPKPPMPPLPSLPMPPLPIPPMLGLPDALGRVGAVAAAALSAAVMASDCA